MKTLVSQIVGKATLWLVLGFMAIAGLGSVVQLRAQGPHPDACSGSCLPGSCHAGCFCSGIHGSCVSR